MSDQKHIETNEERIKRLRKKAMRLPLTPGIYIMRDKNKKIIYIGKAKALKNRVSSYFGSDKNHPEKVRRMVSNVIDFDYILCDSEFEALILECSQIKQHQPHYNILLKDDKGFNYVKIETGDWPTINAVHQKDNDGALYIGPYNSGWAVRRIVESAHKIFKLPTCGKVFPRDFAKARPCLNHHIGLCMAPCTGRIKPDVYNEAINSAKAYIKGGASVSLDSMQKDMEIAAENLEFELAARLRDRIRAAKQMSSKQKVITSLYKTQDFITSVKNSKHACFTVFVFENGRLSDCEQFLTATYDDEAAAMAEFILRYYAMRERIPPRIALDIQPVDSDLLTRFLSEKSGKKVALAVPKVGSQQKLIEMCKNNAAEYLSEKSGNKNREAAALDELAGLLGLKTAPEYIESYDISNHAGSDNVAGMVVFKDGKPYKSAYRKFKIKSFIGQDDYRSMAEVLDRRFNEYEKAQDKSAGFGKLPDLILLDGGEGQINAVLPIMRTHSLNIPIFGMVKDGKHKTRALTANGAEFTIKSNRAAYTIISTVQEEVHRFAIGYHRKSASKNMLTLSLLEIEGVGQKRATALLKQFKSVKKISEASTIELEAVDWVTKPAAEKIYQHFRKT